MKKSNIPILIGFFFLFISSTSIAQNIDSMMNVYADGSATERIHIHFDKNIYNKAETVWYKVYLMQGRDTGFASMNIYLEWYGSDGKPLSQTASPIILSAAAGSFEIPANYTGDFLEIRAYTKWMLNDDPEFLYRRQLLINHPSTKTTSPAVSKTTVAVFPESGNLIQGLQSRIAFKATNAFGNPVFIKGAIADETNSIIDSLEVLHDGMGSFFLTAKPQHQYHLNWIDQDGNTGITPINIAKTEGAQLTVTRIKEKVLFQVERSDKAPSSFKNMVLVIHMNKVGLYQVAINTREKKRINAEIPTLDLPTGLLQFTLFNADWIPVAERVVFINNQKHEFHPELKASQTNVDARGKNVLEIKVPDTLFTSMSLSITDEITSQPSQHTIYSDMFLNSEIKGKIYNPGYYLSGNTDEIASHLDLVMLTNGWRRFDWEKIKAQIGPQNPYALEKGYMKLVGKVSGIKTDKTNELNMVIVSKDSSRQFVSVTLQKDGSFEHSIILFDTAKILYSINNDPILTEKIKLEIQNGLMPLSAKPIQAFNGEDKTEIELSTKEKLDSLWLKQEQLRKKLAETTLKEVTVTATVKTPVAKLDEKYTSGFFRENPARKSYILDLSNPNMVVAASTIMEYLTSRVPGLVVSGNGSMQWRGSSPNLYLNEVRTDLATLSAIPLINVAMIKAFPPIFMFATGGGAGGAVIVYTRNGNDYTPPEIPGLQTLKLSGYNKFKEFYYPNYEQPDASFVKPDNRTTLYWNPDIFTNQTLQNLKVEFFNNDFSKSFRLVLEGINAAGKMTHIEKIIGANGIVE
ncbi:MAG: hypothetical protein CFE25_05125 [Chitinophagaceae bacterium BSSC1]|nr:MAG: hypothetical protein CFE25_05125 [Chitinophagaceae bacterium BSSC1]